MSNTIEVRRLTRRRANGIIAIVHINNRTLNNRQVPLSDLSNLSARHICWVRSLARRLKYYCRRQDLDVVRHQIHRVTQGLRENIPSLPVFCRMRLCGIRLKRSATYCRRSLFYYKYSTTTYAGRPSVNAETTNYESDGAVVQLHDRATHLSHLSLRTQKLTRILLPQRKGRRGRYLLLPLSEPFDPPK